MIKVDQVVALTDCKIVKLKELKKKRIDFLSSGTYPGLEDAWPQYKTFHAGIKACETTQQVRDYDIDFV